MHMRLCTISNCTSPYLLPYCHQVIDKETGKQMVHDGVAVWDVMIDGGAEEAYGTGPTLPRKYPESRFEGGAPPPYSSSSSSKLESIPFGFAEIEARLAKSLSRLMIGYNGETIDSGVGGFDDGRAPSSPSSPSPSPSPSLPSSPSLSPSSSASSSPSPSSESDSDYDLDDHRCSDFRPRGPAQKSWPAKTAAGKVCKNCKKGLRGVFCHQHE